MATLPLKYRHYNYNEARSKLGSKLIMQQHSFELSQSELESVFNNKNTELNNILPENQKDPIAATSLAIGEEGGSEDIFTTQALGEEGGSDNLITTQALGEEGGMETRSQPIEDDDLMVELGKIENNFESEYSKEIEAIVAEELS